MKNLRVYVIPSESGGNEISQRSTVEEIMSCVEADIYPLSDYFQAQNDEEVMYGWTFLIDIEKKENLTGTNIKGIHYF